MTASRLHRESMRILIAEIVGGSLEPGNMLPSETELVEQFGVSRGVVRECIRGLEERGLLKVKHGRGATVNPSREWDVLDPDVLEALLEAPNGVGALEEYLEARLVIEVAGAALAAERRTEEDVVRLRAAFDRMVEAAERADGNPAAEPLYHEADVEFHRAVMLSTGNRALGRMAEPVQRALLARLSLARPERRLERSLPEHSRILQSVVDGNARAAREAMRKHLTTIMDYLEDYRRRVSRAQGGSQRRRKQSRAARSRRSKKAAS
jgi:DNA-binding FadR family transcriptional regulator